MLLVLGGDHVEANHVQALEREFPVVVASSTASARERHPLVRYEAAVVDRSLDPSDVSSFIRGLRGGGEEQLATVAVVDDALPELDVDETVRAPVDPGELVAAVRRAVRLKAYENAVGELFEACRRGRRRRTEQLGALRERADERLQALHTCDDGLPIDRIIDA